MSQEQKLGTLDLPETVPVHLGETADEMPSKLLAVAFETAQYRHDIVRTHNFSSFSGVSGSNTGSDRALHVKVMSFTRACRLQIHTS